MSSHSRPPEPIHVKRTIIADSVDVPKRRKLQHAEDTQEEIQRSPTHILVKREPSPSPPPSLALRTSGTIRIDIPPDCLKSQVGWKERRDKWVAQEISKLKSLGLKVPKIVVREDGLALDWVSKVPVFPLTLRPPSPIILGDSSTQDPEPQQFPSEKPLIDPLGHALRDQTVSAYLSSTAAPKPSVHTHVPKERGHDVSAHLHSTAAPKATAPTHTPKETQHEPLPPAQGIPTGVLSEFVVVGAATRKVLEGPGSEGVAENTSDHTVQREHRKLLPFDLRPSTKYLSNKEGAKKRRLAWITKEIEKVEGYTGEKVGGFRYDGDDVIIQLSNGARRARRQRLLSSKPPQLGRGKPGISHSPRPRSNATLIAGPSGNASGKTHPKAPTLALSEDSTYLSQGATAGEATAIPAEPVPDASSQSTKNTLSSEKAAILASDVSEQMTTLSVSEPISDCSSVFQARGSGFLERYVQIFDSERDALSLAYTPNATFSLTEDNHDSSAAPSFTGGFLQTVKTGRLEIVETLKKIRTDLRHPPPAEIACDIASLDDMSPGGLLLTCKGALLPMNRQQEHRCFFSRVFVLRQNDEYGRETWPLQIVADQLTILNKLKGV